MLDERDREYYRFKPLEEKMLGTISQRIPQLVTTEETKQNLMNMEFEIVAISIMYN